MQQTFKVCELFCAAPQPNKNINCRRPVCFWFLPCQRPSCCTFCSRKGKKKKNKIKKVNYQSSLSKFHSINPSKTTSVPHLLSDWKHLQLAAFQQKWESLGCQNSQRDSIIIRKQVLTNSYY